MKTKFATLSSVLLNIFCLLSWSLCTAFGVKEGPAFELVNAETDEIVGFFSHGDEINLAMYPPKLTFAYDPFIEKVRSVEFIMNGKRARIENVKPYAIGGDINGDYFPYQIPLGSNTLTVVFYNKPKGKGKVLGSETISFFVIDVEPIEVFIDPDPIMVTVPSGENGMANFEITHSPSPYAFGVEVHDYVDLEWVGLPSGLQIGQNKLMASAKNLLPGTYNKSFPIEVFTVNYPHGTFSTNAKLNVIMHVTNSENQLAGSFTVVNADTDEDERTVTYKGTSFDYFGFGTPRMFNVRVNTNPKEVGSVVFEHSYEDYQGNRTTTQYRTENVYPYALFGDKNGNYFSEPFVGGTYFVKATPYSKPRGKGKAGTPIEFEIYLYGDPNVPIPQTATVRKAISPENHSFDKALNSFGSLSLVTYPNPFASQLNIRYVAQAEGETTVDIYSMKGDRIRRVYEGKIQANQPLSISFDAEGLQNGMYFCRVGSAQGMQTHRVILNR